MSNGITVLEPAQLSVVFLCYQEPERESFYQRLKTQAPQAIKVEGIKGFDAAHKEAAATATTDYFVLVDGDALVHDSFWNLRLRLPENMTKGALSFCAHNIVNDLCYGYGGLKIWHKDFVRTMMTHENATDPLNAFEFCWQPGYHHLSSCYNETHINQSTSQAFTAGFREAVKLMCPKGVLTPIENLNYWTQRKLGQWIMLGADSKNGEWVQLGAATAVHELLHKGFDPTLINEYEVLADMKERYIARVGYPDPASLKELLPWMFTPLDAAASLAVKKFVRRPRPQLSFPLEPCLHETE